MVVADSSGTTEVRAAHRFDEEALARWMRANVADFREPLNIAQFRGGQSNLPTAWKRPRPNYVLRRKPRERCCQVPTRSIANTACSARLAPRDSPSRGYMVCAPTAR